MFRRHGLAPVICLSVLALAAFVSVILITGRFGAGLSPDSAYYLSAARSLAAGRGFTAFDGVPLVAWPPLFPTLLAGAPVFGADPLPFARFLNAAAFGAAVFLAGLVFLKGLKWPASAVAGTLGVVTSPLLSVSLRVWTEPVFAVLTLALLLCVARFLVSGSRPALAGACVLAALLCLERYIGVAFVPAVFVLVLFFPAVTPLRRRLVRALLFAASALAPLAAWMARSYVLTRTLTGSGLGRSVNPAAFLSNLAAVFSSITETLLPRLLAPSWLWPLLFALLVAAVVFAVRAALRKPEPRVMMLLAGTVLALSYLLAIVFLVTPEYHDSIPRLLTPAYPLLMLLAIAWLERLARRVFRRRSDRPVSWTLTAIVAAWLGLPLVNLVPACRNWYDNGNGVYDGVEWRNSRLLDWLRTNPLEGAIYSNDPAAIYLLAGMTARMSPRRDADPAASGIRPGDKLVWFRRINRPYLYSVEELSRLFPLEELAFVGDGGVLVFR